MGGVARSGLIRPTPTPFDTETTITAETISKGDNAVKIKK